MCENNIGKTVGLATTIILFICRTITQKNAFPRQVMFLPVRHILNVQIKLGMHRDSKHKRPKFLHGFEVVMLNDTFVAVEFR